MSLIDQLKKKFQEEEAAAKLQIANFNAITPEAAARTPTSELIAGLAAFTFAQGTLESEITEDDEPDDLLEAVKRATQIVSAEIDRRLPGPLPQEIK